MRHQQPHNPAHIRKRTTLGALALTLPLQALSLQVNASAVIGPDNMNFYSPPAMSSGNHGELIWYREADITLNAQSPAIHAWNVLYHSTDAKGQPNVVSGTVIVPDTPWSGSGSRPLITYGVGTHGMAQGCAPSLQLAAGTDYEAANLSAALQRGYTVLITDNPGYTNDSDLPSYMVGKAQAHASERVPKRAMTMTERAREAGTVVT